LHYQINVIADYDNGDDDDDDDDDGENRIVMP